MIGVGIRYILDDREFRQKVRSSNTAAERLTKTNRKHLKTIKDVGRQEKRGITTKKRELDLTKKQTRAIEKQDRVQKKMNRTRKVAGGRITSGIMGQVMPLVGAAAIGGAVVSTVKGAGDRQAKLTQVENMIDRELTPGELKKLRATAVRTGQTLEDVIDSLFIYVSAFDFTGGKNLDPAFEDVEAVGKTATGGGTDIGTIMAGFTKGKAANPNATRDELLALMAGINASGQLDWTDVGKNLGKFLGETQALGGFTKEEAGNLYAMLTQSLGPEQSTSKLKALARSLAKPSPLAEKLGITKETVEKEGFAGIQKRMQGQDPTKIFTSEEAFGAMILIGDDIEDFNASMAKFLGADPKKQFARATDDLNVETTRLGTQWKSMTDTLLEKTGFIKSLADTIGLVTDILDGTEDDGEVLSDKNKEVGKNVLKKVLAATPVGPMLEILEAISKKPEENTKKVGEVKTSIDDQTTAINNQTTSIVEAIEKIDSKPAAEEVEGNGTTGDKGLINEDK